MNVRNSNCMEESTEIVSTKVWLISLLRILQKRGYKRKYKKYLKDIVFCLVKKYENLDQVFINFYQYLFFPFSFRVRVVAGRKVLIPIPIKEEKEILYMVKLINSVVQIRTERSFIDRVVNELIEISGEKGLTNKKILQYYLDLQKNFVNIRFLSKPK